MTSAEVEVRRFPIRLSNDELRARGDELACLVQELEEVEGERKQSLLSYGEQLKFIRSRITAISASLRERQEQRDVECRWVRDVEAGIMRLVRSDTGEDVGARPLSDQERQEVLFEGQN